MNEQQKKEAIEKARRFAELQAKIKQRAQLLQQQPAAGGAGFGLSSGGGFTLPNPTSTLGGSTQRGGDASMGGNIPKPKVSFTEAPSVRVDDQGRLVDETGREIQIPKVPTSLSVNRAAQRQQQQGGGGGTQGHRGGTGRRGGEGGGGGAGNGLDPHSSTINNNNNGTDNNDESGDNAYLEYYDDRLAKSSTRALRMGQKEGASFSVRRQKAAFNFNTQGKYVEEANKIRAEAQLQKLKTQISAATKRSGISSTTKLALLATNKDDSSRMPIPDVEWWDQMVLGERESEQEGEFVHLTNLVEHPLQLEIDQIKSKGVEMPVYLTKKERKKLRTQRRRDAEKDKQELIRAGLVEPDAPKLTMSNFMRSMKDDAIQDPSKVEAEVRAQMEQRQREHEQANASRKLTSEQRSEKKRQKLLADIDNSGKGEMHVALFRIKDMSNPKHRYKVNVNAKEFMFTGCMVLHEETNLVVVEGGPKGLRKFKKLMLQRIRWTEEAAPGAASVVGEVTGSSGGAGGGNRCALVWEGVLSHRNFNHWKSKQCATETDARDFLRRFGVEHYWDMALSQSIVEESQF
eukprot:Nk52_evm56s266 gene=Nk52_evmTU56s266